MLFHNRFRQRHSHKNYQFPHSRFAYIRDPLDVTYSLAPLPEGDEGDRESPLTAIVRAVWTDLLDDVEPDTSPSTSLGTTVTTTTSPGPRRIGPGRLKDIEQVRLQYQSPGQAPCLVTSRPLRKIFLAALSPPPSLLSLVAFSFKSYCEKTTGI